MQLAIKLIREFVSGKTSDKQGIVRGPQVTVLNCMQRAQQYVMAKSVALGPQEEALMQSAETYITEAVKKVNDFYSGRWMNYRRQVEAVKVPLFKDYTPI